MKRIIYLLAVAMLMPCFVVAQDCRNRTTATVVADVMAQLPAKSLNLYDGLMADLAATGSEGVLQMAGMLVPADKGENATVEYALNGLVAYISAPGRDATAVRAGLKEAIGNCSDNVNKSFLISLLGVCGIADDSDFLADYLNDPELGAPAMKSLITLKGSENALAALLLKSAQPDAMLSRAAATKPVVNDEVEDKIIQWAKSSSVGERKDYYFALGRIGSQKSLSLLEKAARAAGYVNDDDGAVEAYTTLLSRGEGRGFDSALLKSSRQVLKSKAPEYVRGAAIATVFDLEGKAAMPELIKALKGDDRAYRVHALRCSEPWVDVEVYAAIEKNVAVDSEAQADVVNWYGTNHVESQLPYVIDCIASTNPEVASAAVEAAAKIGGSEALDALISMLGTGSQNEAVTALAHFNGDITPGIDKALDSDDDAVKAAAINLAGKRHLHGLRLKIFDLAADSNPVISDAAYAMLGRVATRPDFDRLVKIARTAPADKQPVVAAAMADVLLPFEADKQYKSLRPYLANGGNLSVFYPSLAQCGNASSVDILKTAYAGGDRSAFDALLLVDDNDMIPVMYEIAASDKSVAKEALKRYAALVKKSGFTQARLFDLYAKGLSSSDDAEIQKLMLAGLGSSNVFPAITLAASYIANPATAMAASEAVRSIASKNNFNGEEVVKSLEAAKAFYISEGSADSGYAVDDINGLIKKCAAPAVFTLSPEEEAEGFEVLFDGTSMERWTGNKTAYTPVDGAIYVTAQYGGAGNLYTDKEYSDFIYRFEFCFDSPGVNNGIGLRTSHGVDAAYEGMEIQVLDHDNPIYRGLNDYQVHGSVYGIIPAKRIVSPEQGVWNTEEIRAIGDHITVIVNGEVILDGNIRKACIGHNVTADGKIPNPYTVDHQNHPGLFNKKGFISFCGHGPGIKFRNIRIKDLSKK